MNLSELVTRCKFELGIYGLAMPFDNPDGMIEEIIKTFTLKTFSVYNQIVDSMVFKLRELEIVEKHSNEVTYLLPDIFGGREIVFVKSVKYAESNLAGMGYWGSGIPLLHGNMIQQAMIANAGAQLSNLMIPKLTFKYVHPRKITLFNVMTSADIVFEIAFKHDKSLASISVAAEESFTELAILDVKRILYNTLKHYDNLQTAYGNIALKLDDWASAADERKQLISDWNNTYHMDLTLMEYI